MTINPALLRRVEELERASVIHWRVSEAEQARVTSELRRLLPGADLAALLREMADPARIRKVPIEALRIVAQTRMERCF